MVAQIFQEIAAAITAMISAVTSAISGVTSLFYDPTNGMTFLGVLLLIGVGAGLVFWAVNLIRGLIKRV